MKFIHFCLALCCVSLWGINFPLIKILLQELPPLFSAFLRLLFIGLGIFFVKVPKQNRKFILILSMTLFTFTLGPTTFALKSVDASIAALITELEVPFAALLSFFIFGEKLNLKQMLGLMAAFSGIYLISHSPEVSNNNIYSIFMLIAAAFFYGLSAVLIKCIKGSSSLAITIWTACLSAPQILLVSIFLEFHEISQIHSLSNASYYALFFSTAISFFAFYIWNHLISIYPVNKIVPFGMLIPVSSLIFSYILLGETTHPAALLGGVITLLGVWLQIHTPSNRKNKV